MLADLRHKKVLILGFGREGRSSFEYLRKNAELSEIAVADKDEKALNDPLVKDLRVFHGDNYLSALSEFDVVFRSPGIPLSLLQTGSIQVSSQMNLFFSEAPGTIIGVTGTKGKSTTSALIHHLISSQFTDVRLVGNIGSPVLDSLQDSTESTVFVVELSSFQLEDLQTSPHIAVLLGIVPEHLDHHQTFAAYCAAKANITLHQSAKDYLVFNDLSEPAARIAGLSQAKTQRLFAGASANTRLTDNGLLVEGNLLPFSQFSLRGKGNYLNALAATLVAQRLGIPGAVIRERLGDFAPLPHRLETIGTYNKICFVNDSLSTIPEAAINALEAFKGEVGSIILGGYDRGLDYSVLAHYLANNPVQNLILFPTTGERIYQSILELNGKGSALLPKAFFCTSMEDAVRTAYAVTPQDRICLLSPASPSFSTFKDYKDRGDQFAFYVRTIGAS